MAVRDWIMENFTSFVLTSFERPKKKFEYWVTGDRSFPFSMLRFDSAWPATDDDATKIGESDQRRSIRLHSYSPPSTGMWASFSWSVSKKEVV